MNSLLKKLENLGCDDITESLSLSNYLFGKKRINWSSSNNQLFLLYINEYMFKRFGYPDDEEKINDL